MLLDIGRRLQRPLELPWQSFEEMLEASFGALPPATPDVDAWTDAQGKGMWSGTLPAALARQSAAAVNTPPVVHAYEEPRFDGDASEYPFHFLPYPSSTFFDGSLAHLPWLQEMPDPLTSAMWSSWVEDQSDDCGEARASAKATWSRSHPHKAPYGAPVVIAPGIAPDVVAMPVGQGHRLFTRYASGRGANPMEILAPLTEPVTGALAWAATRVRMSRIGPPDGRLILFAGGMRDRRGAGEVID